MKVLVTGGTGFLGSHLVERLETDGHDVVAAQRRDYDLTRWEDGVAKTIAWYAENHARWIGRVDWLSTGRPAAAARR
jgi:uncharacterized protein YbjT (DUF2867 family)